MWRWLCILTLGQCYYVNYNTRSGSTMTALRAAAKHLVIVTGASRGFGEALAVEVAKTVKEEVTLDLHLVARNKVGLESTKEQVQEVLKGRRTADRVSAWPVDLGKLDTLQTELEAVFKQFEPPSAYERAVLFNNAGSLGPLGYCETLTDLTALRAAIDMNVTSYMYLTSMFLRSFGAQQTSVQGGTSSVVVNVSSLAAIEPFETWGVYCSGKAARDMYASVVAKERAISAVKVLTYAPGPLDTDMQALLRDSEGVHVPLKEMFCEAFKEGKLVSPEESARKCVQILHEDKYVSGQHIDYYDPPLDQPRVHLGHRY